MRIFFYKSISVILTLFFFLFFSQTIFSQVVPSGLSSEFITIETPINSTLEEGVYELHYYKPSNYDSLNSPILWYVHGSGGDGTEGAAIFTNIAERRNALIVSPTMHNGLGGWAYVSEMNYDTIMNKGFIVWSTEVFKQIYRHILQRENRDSIPVYLTGFSQGAQFVTRYMLIRQFDPDSIPISMSVSVDPANYTFCTDTLFGTEMNWTWYRCGLSGESPISAVPPGIWEYTPVDSLICSSHIKQYYNENYGVLIGTHDTTDFTSFCVGQGADRYERAQNFYAFSDTNAINRGTTLQWEYAEVPGVGHNGMSLYQTKAVPTDTVTIAEALLFDTPYHPVPNFLPVADFIYATSELTVDFTNLSENYDSVLWDFGDGLFSTVFDPQHIYAVSGTYTVCLTVNDKCTEITVCDTFTVIGTEIDELINNELIIFPNPAKEEITIKSNLGLQKIEILDLYGRNIKTIDNINEEKQTINITDLKRGLYFIRIWGDEFVRIEKVLINR